MKFIKLSILALIVLASSACVYGEDMTFIKPAGEATREVGALLDKRGICVNGKVLYCGSDVYAKAPLRDGFVFSTHGIRDPALLAETKNIILRKFHATPDMTRVILFAYAADGIPPSQNHRFDGLIYRQEFRKDQNSRSKNPD